MDTRNFSSLSLDEQIAHSVTVLNWSHAQAALEYRVNSERVYQACFEACFNGYLQRTHRSLDMLSNAEYYQIDETDLKVRLFKEACGRNDIPKDDPEYMNIREIAITFGWTKSTFSNMRTRETNGQEVFPGKGRPGPLTSAQSAVLTDMYKNTQTDKVKDVDEDFATKVSEVRLEDQNVFAQDRGMVFDELSKDQMYRLKKNFLPEDANPTITNERREEALNDPFNAIVNAAMLYAVLDPTDENPDGRFRPELVSNHDAMSVVIGRPAKNKRVYMPEGSTAALKALGRSPSRLSRPGERKERSIKLLATALSTGHMSSAIHSIKQRTCKKLEVVHLGTLTTACEHYAIIIPARPRKAELQKILELEELAGKIRALENLGDNLDVLNALADEIQFGDDEDDLYEEDHADKEPLPDEDEDDSLMDPLVEMVYKDNRYPTDAEIATVQFAKIILPNLIARRREIMVTLTQLGPEYENPELLGILHTLDGEYPYIELIMSRLLNWAKENKIELYKYAGGCSLWQQALDLAKVFWHWRTKMSMPPMNGGRAPHYPAWAQVLKARLEFHHMDKASVNLYMENYFLRIPSIFPDVFSHHNVWSGFDKAGVNPFSLPRLLSSCPTIVKLPDSVALELLPHVVELGKEARFGKQWITDAEVAKKVGYLGITTPIKNMDDKALNHRRSCWLNGEGAQEARRNRRDRAVVAAAEKAAAAEKVAQEKKAKEDRAQAKKVAEDLFQQKLTEASTSGSTGTEITAQKWDFCDCGKLVSIAEGFTGWRQCSVFNCVYKVCNNQACQKRLVKHLNIHFAASESAAAEEANPLPPVPGPQIPRQLDQAPRPVAQPPRRPVAQPLRRPVAQPSRPPVVQTPRDRRPAAIQPLPPRGAPGGSSAAAYVVEQATQRKIRKTS
jgi:hypothetical protein